MLTTVLTAAAAFAATNVDDLVVLAVLFAQPAGGLGTWQVVAGQALGFGALVLASLAAGAGLLALPGEAVGLLGLVPLALGLLGLARALRGRRDDGHDEPAPAVGSTGAVALLTVVNGADNIAVYAPLFATAGREGLPATLVVFAVLLGVWCAVARFAGRRRAVRRAVAAAGAFAVPVVLVALGAVIVAESGLLA